MKRKAHVWALAIFSTLCVLAGLGSPAAQAATFSVTNTGDSGGGSLRQAILDANATPGADTITFAAGVTGTIALTSGQLTVTDNLTINGPGAANLTISGNGAEPTAFITVKDNGTTTLCSPTAANDGTWTCTFPASNNSTLHPYTNQTVSDSVFSGNDAGGGCCFGLDGGAIANSGGTVTVSRSTFSANGAGGSGGGIYSAGGTLTVAGSVFSGNHTNNWGGGIFNGSGSTLTVTDSTFSGNTDVYSGGGIGNLGGTAIVSKSTFSGNSTSFSGGGGIWNNAGTLSVTNSTFSGNSATFAGFSTGGGISNDAVATVTNSTFSGNGAGTGGGIWNGGTLTLSNTIVANSLSGGNCGGAITDAGANLQYPGSDCGGMTSADPMLGALQNNGGPTDTMALPLGSPALDVPAADASCQPTDQRGVTRPQAAHCDIGAFELVQFHYTFSGFFQPVDNPPTFNRVKAGGGIPVKFSLGGNQGLDIFAAGYPRSERIDCDSSGSMDDVEQTVTAGGSSLSYNATADQYTYTWKTDKPWASTCRRLTVRLNDNTDHFAFFSFTK